MIEYFSYLDPGTGSIIFQSLVGVVAGVGIFGRRIFNGVGSKIRGVLSRSNPNKQ